MSTLDEVARSWLSDPPWQKVFKHTFDVLEDYVSYILITTGAISLSVRLLSTLGSGDLSCTILGVHNGTIGQIDPYPSGSTLGLINYASTDETCIRAVQTIFMEYLPYILLLETITLVIVEKFSFKIPRIAQKVERFYTNIVEESLFGKDPDVAEDVRDPINSIDSISRRRQRNEICVSLKRSTIISRVYLAKNLAEIILDIIFVTVNVVYALNFDDTKSQICGVNMMEVHGILPLKGTIYFQCRGKKMRFFVLALYIQTILLSLHGICSVGALIWYCGFRSVSNLLHRLCMIDEHKGDFQAANDFLFLFDLLGHSSGLESTLRVLTHSDDTFYERCRPKVDITKDIFLEEDKLKIQWRPTDIELWSRKQQPISIECYEVTIFPAETVQNTFTVMADPDISFDESYCAWFFDLRGGRTEYVVTIACVIGKSRLKGEKVVTNLVPYGPEKPRTGMIRTIASNQAEIFWDPPKGEFTKYTLVIDKVTDESDDSIADIFTRQISLQNASRKIENLSSKLTSYNILGLEPGEAYTLSLGTKTGNVQTRQNITDLLLTKPPIISGALISGITDTSCSISWLIPDKVSRLRGFQIKVSRHSDSKVVRIVAVKKSEKKFKLFSLAPGTDYCLSIIALCTFKGQKSESDAASVDVTTLPEPAKDLQLDWATPNAIGIKWEVPTSNHGNKWRIWCDSDELNYHNVSDIPGDRAQYNVSKLPEVTGTGREYSISIASVIVSPKSNQEVLSFRTSSTFVTKPLPPSNFKVSPTEPLTFIFDKSNSPTVSSYRIKWRASGDDPSLTKPEELIFTPEEDESNQTIEVRFTFPTRLLIDIVYKINVYSVLADDSIESKELHEKIIVTNPVSMMLNIYNESSVET